MKPKLIVFASGTKGGSSSTTPLGFSKTGYRQENLGGGGSGFENLVSATKTEELDAEIVAVVSNNERGDVRRRADRLGIPFVYFPGPFDAEHYQKVVAEAFGENAPKNGFAISGLTPWPQGGFTGWIALSGWLKKVEGLDPRKTFNIHPALLSQLNGRFGGHGMYGKKVHEAVKAALDSGEISESGFTMHFVTDEMDRGPIFFEHRVPLHKGMTVEEIEEVVKAAEHEWQPKITNMVVHGQIRWDGKDPNSLVVSSV